MRRVEGGDISLTRQIALDYARENIRVLTVCPGGVDTPMWRAAFGEDEDVIQTNLRDAGELHPVGRIGQPEDIANVVVFLASSRASFMTGEYVCVDGGLMAIGPRIWGNTPVSRNVHRIVGMDHGTTGRPATVRRL